MSIRGGGKCLRTIHTQLQKTNLRKSTINSCCRHRRSFLNLDHQHSMTLRDTYFLRRSYSTTTTTTDTTTTTTTNSIETSSSNNNKEKSHATTLDFQKTNLEDIWADYTERVEKQLELTDSDFILLCGRIKKEVNTQAPQESIRRIQSILREIHKRHLSPNTFVRGCNMLIHLFISHGDIKSAKLVVDGMMRSNYPPDTITVKTIVNGLTYKNQLGEINEFYQTLQERDMWPETTELYRMMVWIFANRDDVEGARHYYAAYLKKQNIMTEDPKNMDSVYNAMIQVYGSVNQPEGALAVYKQMIKRGHPAPTTATYHILLGLLRQYKMQDQMDKVYQDLKQAASAKDGSVEINGSHLSAMGWKPKQVLSEMHALGIPCNVRDYNTFIVSYVKKNKFQDALDIYNHMVQAGVEPDVYSYSIILDTLVKDHEQPAQAAFDFYEVIKEQGLSPDVVIYTSLISACAKTEDLDKAMSLLKEMESFGLHPNVYTFNSLFGLLSRKKQLKLPDDMECVNLLWDKMKRLKVNPDTRSYNMHFALLAKMMQPSIVKEEYTGSSTMEWMGKGIKTSPPLNRMLQLYKSMKQHCRPDFASHTIMINTLVASGHLRQAMQVYEDAKIARSRLPVSVYNEIMGALEKAKRMSQIMTIWHDMKAAQVLPDDRTYTLALDACEQLGLAESFETIRAQRKKDIDRLLELDRKQIERMENANYNNQDISP